MRKVVNPMTETNAERLNVILDLYKSYESDDDLTMMIAALRDKFLNHDTVSEINGWDISSETVGGPEHVIYYIAQYIQILEKMLEGNDGMSVKEIRAQFVDMHRDYLRDYSKSENENKRLREALESIRWNTFATNPQAMIMKDIARQALKGEGP